MDIEKQRQHRRDNVRLTENGNARNEQLLVVPTEFGLSGSERRRPSCFLDMKYRTCLQISRKLIEEKLLPQSRLKFIASEPLLTVAHYSRQRSPWFNRPQPCIYTAGRTCRCPTVAWTTPPHPPTHVTMGHEYMHYTCVDETSAS